MIIGQPKRNMIIGQYLAHQISSSFITISVQMIKLNQTNYDYINAYINHGIKNVWNNQLLTGTMMSVYPNLKGVTMVFVDNSKMTIPLNNSYLKAKEYHNELNNIVKDPYRKNHNFLNELESI